MPTRFYVTTPIYYINDVPHLGTAYTTIAADVLARYHRLRGHDTRFLTGTDEHGLKIERVAKEQGLSSQAFADKMAAPFKELWPRLACSYDDFIRTTEPRHESMAQELWKRVAERGDLYLGGYEGWYCVGCEAYYTEKELEPGNLCPDHKKPVERVKEPSYFFRLSKYQDRLLAWYEKNPSFVMPHTRMNEVKSFVKGGLDDLSVSRTTFDWGVPVPGDPKHVMWVWFDALPNYWTAVQQPEDLRRFWPANLHLVGKDILRFHAIYWPAFLMSAGFTDDELPRQVFAHGWMTINGQKMSKSLRNTVSPAAILEAFGSPDPLRYYLMTAIAFGQDGDFNLRDLIQRYNSELGNSLGNLLNRILPQCAKHFENRVPPKDHGKVVEPEPELHELFAAAASGAREALDQVSPYRAIPLIWQFVAATNAYIDKSAPWAAAKQGDTERLGRILTTSLEALDAISRMIWPIMPGKAAEIREQLGLSALDPKVDADLWPTKLPERAAGEKLGDAKPIFPRIDPDREAEILASLGFGSVPSPSPKMTSTATSTSTAISTSTATSTATFDDFAKLDLRVGLVVTAEKVKGKDKLLSLTVDLGEGTPRPIVAGLALSFQPEELVGKRVVVVANLEPRKFGKGLESRGMILAAGPSEALQLATVSGDAAPGTKVK